MRLKVLPRTAVWVFWSGSSRCISSSWYRNSTWLSIADFTSLSFKDLNQWVKVWAAARRTSHEASSRRFRTSGKEHKHTQTARWTAQLSSAFQTTKRILSSLKLLLHLGISVFWTLRIHAARCSYKQAVCAYWIVTSSKTFKEMYKIILISWTFPSTLLTGTVNVY